MTSAPLEKIGASGTESYPYDGLSTSGHCAITFVGCDVGTSSLFGVHVRTSRLRVERSRGFHLIAQNGPGTNPAIHVDKRAQTRSSFPLQRYFVSRRQLQ